MEYIKDSVYVISRDDRTREYLITALFRCSQCRAPSLGFSNASGSLEEHMRDSALSPRWIPASAEGKDFPEVPGSRSSTADEAHRCNSIQAYRGAIALARAALEATAKDQDFTSGNLQKKIADMTGATYHPASTAAELNSVFQNLPLNLIVKHQATEVSFAFVGLGGLLASLSLLLGKAWRPLP